MTEFNYDLLVIGSGPGGQSAALQAASLGKRVGLIETQTLSRRCQPADRYHSQQGIAGSRLPGVPILIPGYA